MTPCSPTFWKDGRGYYNLDRSHVLGFFLYGESVYDVNLVGYRYVRVGTIVPDWIGLRLS